MFEKLIDLYVEYGFYKEDLISITKKGMDGQQQIAAMMEGYRNNPPKSINGVAVVQLLDYELQKGKNLQTGESGQLNCPNQMCCSLYWQMAARFLQAKRYRAKIKFYFSVNTKLNSAADFEKVNTELDKKDKGIIKDMKLK